MKSIGPYVVLREVTVGGGSGSVGEGEGTPPRRAISRILWAADRLTGLPVLLHPLGTIAPAPRLPAHPRLLPFTDMVVEMAGAYLATELPPQTRPARDPMQAARGALEALDFLHAQGLGHGSLDAAQLWEVDGQVRVTGAGLPRPGLRPEPLSDLRDLVAALETLDAPPALLAALRGAPDLASAREFLDLLDMGLSEQQLAGALEHVPALGTAPAPPPAIFDSPADIVLGGALADDLLGPAPGFPAGAAAAEEAAPVPIQGPTQVPAPVTVIAARTGDHEPHGGQQRPADNVASDTLAPDTLAPDTLPPETLLPETVPTLASPGLFPSDPVGAAPQAGPDPTGMASTNTPSADTPSIDTPSAETVLEAPAPARPRAVRRTAGRQARERLKADHRRRLDLSELRLRRTAAEVEQLQGATEAASLPPGPAAGDADEYADGHGGTSSQEQRPQERRRLEQQAWEEQAALDARLAAARRAQAPQGRPASVLAPGIALGGELAEIAEVQRRPRTLPLPTRAQNAVRTARQLAPIRMGWGRDGERQVLRRRGPREELLRWLLPTLGLLLLAFAVSALPRALKGPPAPCCDVEFRLLGAGAGQQATLTLLAGPAGSGVQAGARLGQIPGTVRLPAPGSYRLKLSADGYAPARLDVTAPRREPVTVQLGR